MTVASVPPRRVLLKCSLLVVLAWVLQLLFMLPLVILGMHLSEGKVTFLPRTPLGLLLLFAVFYLCFVPASVLVIWAAHLLAVRLHPRLRFVELLQPSLLFGTAFGLSTGGIAGGIVFAAFGYVNVFLWHLVRRRGRHGTSTV